MKTLITTCEPITPMHTDSIAGGPAPSDGGQMLTVTDLKQYTYCPRVVWYTYCLPLLRPETAKMQESQRQHEEERTREARRSLRAYGLPEGERRYDVPLVSTRLGLTGRTDLVIVTADEVIPVDYKLTRRATASHFRLQLAAYGLMLEEAVGLPARRGFVYSLWTRQAEEVRFTARLRGQVLRTLTAAHHMIAEELMPGPPRRRGRCVSCEFRRFCGDT